MAVAPAARITRRYVQLKLNRDRRLHVGDGLCCHSVRAYIDSLKQWLKGQPKRTKQRGGIGR